MSLISQAREALNLPLRVQGYECVAVPVAARDWLLELVDALEEEGYAAGGRIDAALKALQS